MNSSESSTSSCSMSIPMWKHTLSPQASLSLWAPYNADDNERALIEYFGHATFLNRQRGSFYTTYVLPARDVDIFESLRTKFNSKFLGTAIPNPALIPSLTFHYTSIQAFANTHPQTIRTAWHSFTDGIRDRYITQSTPLQYKNHTIVAFLGKDITLEGFTTGHSFLGAKRRVGLQTRDFIRKVSWPRMEWCVL